MPEVCDAIIEALACEYMRFPSNKEEFPHCIGAIDGKHIALSNPVDNGSTYFNYKGLFNIVLLALKIVNFINSFQAGKTIFHRLPQSMIYQT